MVLAHQETLAHQLGGMRRPIGVGHIDGTVNDQRGVFGHTAVGGDGHRGGIDAPAGSALGIRAGTGDGDVFGVIGHAQADVLDRQHRRTGLVDVVAVGVRVQVERLAVNSDGLECPLTDGEVEGVPDLGHGWQGKQEQSRNQPSDVVMNCIHSV